MCKGSAEARIQETTQLKENAAGIIRLGRQMGAESGLPCVPDLVPSQPQQSEVTVHF